MQTKTIGERVANLRKKRSLNQEELARLLLVKQCTVSRWESGEVTISAEEAGKIAKTLNVTCDYLILGERSC